MNKKKEFIEHRIVKGYNFIKQQELSITLPEIRNLICYLY